MTEVERDIWIALVSYEIINNHLTAWISVRCSAKSRAPKASYKPKKQKKTTVLGIKKLSHVIDDFPKACHITVDKTKF